MDANNVHEAHKLYSGYMSQMIDPNNKHVNKEKTTIHNVETLYKLPYALTYFLPTRDVIRQILSGDNAQLNLGSEYIITTKLQHQEEVNKKLASGETVIIKNFDGGVEVLASPTNYWPVIGLGVGIIVFGIIVFVVRNKNLD
jgi:hypothetical protein